MNFITDANGNIDVFAIVITVTVFVIIFLLSRKVNMWYWKINEFKKSQEEQIRLLKKIAGEKESEEDIH